MPSGRPLPQSNPPDHDTQTAAPRRRGRGSPPPLGQVGTWSQDMARTTRAHDDLMTGENLRGRGAAMPESAGREARDRPRGGDGRRGRLASTMQSDLTYRCS